MAAINGVAPNKWKFVVETLPTIKGHSLKASKPDADGYFKVVLAALGVPTRAGIIYDPEPFMEAMTDPSSRFRIMLNEGYLYGHRDHPRVRTKEDIPELMEIRNEYVSHRIKSVESGPILPDGAHLILGKVKPMGEYGPQLTENFLDPDANTSFSLRALCQEYNNPQTGYVHRKTRLLVTFDWVSAPGYEYACARYVPGTENFAIPVTLQDFFSKDINGKDKVACEGYTDQEILRAFGVSKVDMGEAGTYYKGVDNRSFLDGAGQRRSLVHHFLSNTDRR